MVRRLDTNELTSADTGCALPRQAMPRISDSRRDRRGWPRQESTFLAGKSGESAADPDGTAYAGRRSRVMNPPRRQPVRTESGVRVACRCGFGLRQRQQRARRWIRRNSGCCGRERQRRFQRQRRKHRRGGRDRERRLDRGGGSRRLRGRDGRGGKRQRWTRGHDGRGRKRQRRSRRRDGRGGKRAARGEVEAGGTAGAAGSGNAGRGGTGGTNSCAAVTCALGRMCCDGFCVNLQNDPFNCGACGKVCEGSHVVLPQRNVPGADVPRADPLRGRTRSAVETPVAAQASSAATARDLRAVSRRPASRRAGNSPPVPRVARQSARAIAIARRTSRPSTRARS